MFRFFKQPRTLSLGLALGLAIGGATSALAFDNYSGVGRDATPAEVKAWDIDVRPDFRGLPKGSGTVDKGQELFEARCASCHGSFAESNEVFTPLVGGTTKDDVKTGHVKSLVTGSSPQRTTFMKVATISTLFDYINRAMPWTSPKSLKPDEVYAILAYLLNLADIVPGDFTLSDKNIADVQKLMPNRNGMVTDHGLWAGASAKKGGIGNGGKPDTQNKACMSNCKTEVQIGSALPDYAWNAHGNLAEQSRDIGPARGKLTGKAAEAKAKEPASPNAIAGQLAQNNGCLACHGVSNKIVGPGYNEVAAKYKGAADAEARLMGRIKAGGQGTWGAVAMPPQPQLKDEEAKALAKWILSGAPAK